MMSNNTPKCLIFGAGAIGKAVGGYGFSQAGAEVLFADISAEAVSDINERSGYDLIVSETEKDQQITEVRGLHAVMSDSNDAYFYALEADFICTSVGQRGLEAILPLIVKIIKNRKKELHIVLLENIHGCDRLVINFIAENTGHFPEYVTVDYACVERMSKIQKSDKCLDVICEQWFPVILPGENLKNTFLRNFPDLFLLTDRIDEYYARKLFLGNLGHAVLGYMGIPRGYNTVSEAMSDRGLEKALTDAFSESVFALKNLYGSRGGEFAVYAESRIRRLKNRYFEDTLKRVVRSPLRKLGKDERMIMPALICMKNGRIPETLLTVIAYAVHYMGTDDPECIKMKELYLKGGCAEVLDYSAGLGPESPLVRGVISKEKNINI